MAYADEPGLGEQRLTGWESEPGGEPDRCDGPLFPPGPYDLELWARVLAKAPEAEPALCGMADGMADRLEYRADRLRTIGNGVVPLQAAYAVRTLAARGGWELGP